MLRGWNPAPEGDLGRGRLQALTWGVGHCRPFVATVMMLVARMQLKMLKYRRYGLSLQGRKHVQQGLVSLWKGEGLPGPCPKSAMGPAWPRHGPPSFWSQLSPAERVQETS